MPAALIALLAGVVMVLYGVIRSALAAHYTCGIWWSGIGTVLVVLSLFWVAGYNDTPTTPRRSIRPIRSPSTTAQAPNSHSQP